MGLLDARVDRAFRSENGSRVVVFGDRGGRGYVVASPAEEAKIRSFLKMYHFSECWVVLLGSSLAYAWSTFFANLQSFGKAEAHPLRTTCIYLAMSALLVGGPSLLLWRSYKKSLLSFTSAENEVAVSGRGPQRRPWVGYAVLAIALLLLAVIVFYLTLPK